MVHWSIEITVTVKFCSWLLILQLKLEEKKRTVLLISELIVALPLVLVWVAGLGGVSGLITVAWGVGLDTK